MTVESRRKPDWVAPPQPNGDPGGVERVHMKLDAETFFALAYLMKGRAGVNTEKSEWLRRGVMELAKQKAEREGDGFDATRVVHQWQITGEVPDFVRDFTRQPKKTKPKRKKV